MGHERHQEISTTQAAAGHEASHPDVDAEHDHERARRVSVAALHRELSKTKARAGDARVKQLIGIIDRHVKVATNKLDAATHGLDPAEAASMKRSVSEERDSLIRLSSNIPSQDPLLVEALESAEAAQAVIARLEAVGRADAARSGISEISNKNDQERQDLAAAGARKSPDGFCDLAPSRVEPCHLSEARRAELRAQIRFVVTEASSSWKSAIVDAKVVEKLKRETSTFEQQLGQLLFGMLFNVVGGVAKTLVAKGIDRADAALGETQNFWGGSERAGGMASDDKKLVQSAGGTLVDKATPIAQAKMQEGITARQLADQAAQAVAVPNDKVSFLAALESAPSTWASSINTHVSQLVDTDLEALHVALPSAETFSIQYFRAKIDDLRKRFEEQVLAVQWWHQTKPCQVLTADGNMRSALIAPEKARNKELHGEWKDVEVQTGKWSFVRWIDDDMKGMAAQRAIQHEGAAAGALIRRADDTSFWSADALPALKNSSDDNSQHDQKH